MRRLVYIIGGILLAVAGVLAYQRLTTPPPTPVVTQAPSEPRVAVVSAEARLVPARQARLAFNTTGRVQEVLVEEGDTVQAGQVVARLDAAAWRDAVRQAEAGLQIAQAQVERVKAGPSQEAITVAEVAVKLAQTQLERVKSGPRPEDIGVAETAVKLAEAQLERAKAGARPEDIAVAQAGLNAARTDLARARVGATAQDLESARLAVEQAKNILWGAQAQRDAVCGRTDDAPKALEKLGIPQADCDRARATVNSSEQAVQIAEQAYQKLAVGPRAEDINTVAARVEQAQAQVRVAQAGPRAVDIFVAQMQVEQAQAQLKVAQAGPQATDIRLAEMGVEQAQAQLAQAKAGPRPADIAAAQAEVIRAESALEAAKTALADAELKAPFTGIVAQVLLRPGEAATLATPALLIGDVQGLRLVTEDLSETDIARIAVGQPGTVAMDALPGQTFKATVTRISPMSVQNRGDTVYTVWLQFEGGVPQGALWGMQALVDIQVD